MNQSNINRINCIENEKFLKGINRIEIMYDFVMLFIYLLVMNENIFEINVTNVSRIKLYLFGLISI